MFYQQLCIDALRLKHDLTTRENSWPYIAVRTKAGQSYLCKQKLKNTKEIQTVRTGSNWFYKLHKSIYIRLVAPKYDTNMITKYGTNYTQLIK